MSYDISPDPQTLIRAIQAERFAVSQGLAELLDNSFGVGEATRVRITYDRKARTISVLDNGKGMENVGMLFRIGGHLAGPNSISEYGYGGTKAIMSLGRKVAVITMRDGEYARVYLRWLDVKHIPHFVDDSWRPASAAGGKVPAELLEQRQGTYVHLALPPKRQILVNNIKRDLTRDFAPGLRKGLHIEWEDENGISELAAPQLPPDSIPLDIAFQHEDGILRAVGGASFTPGLTRDQSGISIGFWARTILPTTRLPFRDADGDPIDGTGVSGYVELLPGWQPYLVATKQGIDDDRARRMLMDELAKQLAPLLAKVQESHLDILCEDLALEMAAAFGTKVGASLESPEDPDGELVADPDGEERIHPGEVGGGGGGEGTPASRHAGQKTKFRVIRQTDDEMRGALFAVEVREQHVLGYINEEHAITQLALRSDPPNRALMLYGIVRDLGPAIWEEESSRTRFLTRGLVQEIDGLEEGRQVPVLVRRLMDRVS